MSEVRASMEGETMENQETKRIEQIEIGIVDAIKYTATLLLAFIMDSEKPVTLKD